MEAFRHSGLRAVFCVLLVGALSSFLIFGDNVSGLLSLSLLQLVPFVLFGPNLFSLVLFGQFVWLGVNRYYHLFWYGPHEYMRISDPSLSVLIGATVACIASYTLLTRTIRKASKKSFGLEERFSTRVTTWLVGLGALSLLGIHLLPVSLRSQAFCFQSIFVVILFCLESKKARTELRVFKMSYAFITILYFVKFASLAHMGNLALVLFLLLVKGQKYYLAPFLGLVFAIGVGQSAKGLFRMAKVEPAAKAQTLAKIVYEDFVLDRNETIQEHVPRDLVKRQTSGEPFVFRSRFEKWVFSLLRIGDNSLFHVLKKTPHEVPFVGMKVYEGLASFAIPRVFWPNKPNYQPWNAFGRRYGILSANDFETSVGFHIYSEAYMGGGFSWLLICAIFFGALLAFVERVSQGGSGLEGQIFFIVMAGCFFFPQTATVLLSNLLRLTLSCLFLLVFFKKTVSYESVFGRRVRPAMS